MLFGSLNMVLTTMFKVTGAAEKIKDILTYNPAVPYEQGLIIPEHQVKGEITFKNVTFEYPTKKGISVLDNFSFEVKQN